MGNFIIFVESRGTRSCIRVYGSDALGAAISENNSDLPATISAKQVGPPPTPTKFKHGKKKLKFPAAKLS